MNLLLSMYLKLLVHAQIFFIIKLRNDYLHSNAFRCNKAFVFGNCYCALLNLLLNNLQLFPRVVLTCFVV